MSTPSTSPSPSARGKARPSTVSDAPGHRRRRAPTGLPWLLAAASLLASPAAGSPTAPAERPVPTVADHKPSGDAFAAPGSVPPSLLQIDDGTAEGVFGFTGPGTRQFLFFNRFESPGPFILDSIEVLFPAGTEIEPGDAVQLAVYTVTPGGSAAGAELRLRIDTAVQGTDGVQVSTYPLAEPLELLGGDDLLIGVVNRYYETGSVPEQTQPAAIDTTAPAGSSYFALWSGDADDPPELSEAIEISALDGVIAANFMIRGGGRPAPVVDVPTLGPFAALLMLSALMALGLGRLRKRR
ncbi:MAG: hypothetical protein AAGD06_20160 [Acidobacteriota bacterium]